MPSHLALHGTSSTTTHKRQITGSPTAHARVADEVAGEYRASVEARLPSTECDDRTQLAEAASEARCGARGGAERRRVQLGAVGCTENDVCFFKAQSNSAAALLLLTRDERRTGAWRLVRP